METNNNQNTNEVFLKKGGQDASGMKVPKGYFESFDKAILTKIKAEQLDNKVIPIASKTSSFKIWTIVAVAASLIWAAFWVFSPNNQTIDSTTVIAETITEWDYYDDVDDYLLAENFTTSELENIEFEEEYISSEEIYEYIQEQDYSEFLLTENF